MTKFTTFRLRNFTIDHVTSNGHILANCRLNSRIEKIKMDGRKIQLINLSLDRKQIYEFARENELIIR